jgi:hypothetical protein
MEQIETQRKNFDNVALNSLQDNTAEIMPATIVPRKRRQVIRKLCGGKHYSKTLCKVLIEVQRP